MTRLSLLCCMFVIVVGLSTAPFLLSVAASEVESASYSRSVSTSFEFIGSTSKCVQQGGTCKDIRSAKCTSGAFVSGLCAGDANIRCCPKAASAATTKKSTATTTTTTHTTTSSKCVTAGGRCVDSSSFSCSLPFKTGQCPGSSAIRCCPKGGQVKSKTTTPVTATPVSTGTVTWAKLKKCYPQGTAPQVKEKIGGAVNAAWITNTCAIRMSQTVNCAGKLVPQSGGESIRGANNWNFIFRVKQLSPLFKKWWGNGYTVKAPTGRGVPLAAFTGKKGIIYFDTTGTWEDATGHFDLWDGKLMIESSHHNTATVTRYFASAISITLWQFK